MKTPKHTEWEGLVDPTWFGLMAGYLRSPRSPIDYLIHVKDRDILCKVAERIQADLDYSDVQPHRLSPIVEELVAEGAVKVSSRHPVANLDPGATVDPERICSSATCHVLYLPPYYVLHTPGLFEGELTVGERATQAQSAGSNEASMVTTARRTKDEGHEQGQ